MGPLNGTTLIRLKDCEVAAQLLTIFGDSMESVRATSFCVIVTVFPKNRALPPMCDQIDKDFPRWYKNAQHAYFSKFYI